MKKPSQIAAGMVENQASRSCFFRGRGFLPLCGRRAALSIVLSGVLSGALHSQRTQLCRPQDPMNMSRISMGGSHETSTRRE